MNRFFVDRPVFAGVISIVIVLAGLVAMRVLPIAQYPELTPPQVVVSASFPGASADVLAQTVAAPIEEQINGVENMLYMQSTNSGAGSMRLIVTFATGTNADQATINVNNRVQRAISALPTEVQRLGVTVTKQSSSILAIAALSSSNERYDSVFLANYALLNVIDELKRTPGVGEATLFSRENYSMRVWLRPDKLAQYKLTTDDIAAAIREQNEQYAAGRIGDPPNANPLFYSYAVTTDGRLPNPEAFGDIILKSDANAATLRLRDVARIDLGAQDYSFRAIQAGKPTVPIAIYLQPGANALNTIAAVKNTLDEISKRMPEGVSYALPYDTTLFVQESIKEVIKTFAQALALVVVVVFVFLQNWRATLIPLIAVPVSIFGTFAGIYALGFSINLLTLFGLVLAIGIVVDDAIVVLENVERIMATEKLPPREATVKAMGEVTGPVVAIVLVLDSVFVPVAFMGGLAGQMYRQFAITIAVSVTLSGIVALTLTPALCALLLKSDHRAPAAPFRLFNAVFRWITQGYIAGVRFFLKHAILGLMLFAVVIGSAAYLFVHTPSALVPEEDQGVVLAIGILPPAAALSRTNDVMSALTANTLKHPAVENVLALSGFDLLAGAQSPSAGAAFVKLKDWSARTSPDLDARIMPRTIMGLNAGIQDGLVLAFNPPPIQGLSTTGGFELYVQDRAGTGTAALLATTEAVVAAASKRPELTGVRTTMTTNVPQYRISVDREKAKALGVPLTSIFSTMQATFGSLYVNDFTLYGRNFQVKLQSEANFREKTDDLRQIFIRSDGGSMIPLDSLVTINRIVGPDLMERFNNFPAAKVMGNPAPGYTSGQALQVIRQVAADSLSTDYAVAWTGSAYQEIATGGTSAQALIFGVIMVFLILAAQYEQWALPFAVILAVPFALLGALGAIWTRGLSDDVYFQISLVTLIGLASKNAILLVEFAVLQRKQGLGVIDAALAAARLRFRPIIMTSFAFILGVLPLAISTGAGSASRHSIGTGVIGGMSAATFVATLFIPLFFRLIDRSGKRAEAVAQPTAALTGDTGRRLKPRRPPAIAEAAPRPPTDPTGGKGRRLKPRRPPATADGG